MSRHVLVVAAVIGSSSSVLAQPAGAQAEVLFRQGRELLTAGKIAEACNAFAESQKLEPAASTLINLAGCREKQGELATAWGLFLDAERQTRAKSDAAMQQLHDVAYAHAAKLEPRVSKLTVNVPQASQVDGLEIARDQVRIDAAIWNRALPLDGGTYTITAHAPGTNTWSTQVTVGPEGDTKSVDVPDLRTLPRDVTPPPTATAAVTTPVPSDRARPTTSAHASRVGPVLAGAGALVMLGGGLGFELWGNSTYNDAKAEMTNQARRDSLYSSANDKRYTAGALAIGGIAVAGVAVWLYVSGRHETARPTASRIFVSPTGVALVGGF